MPSDTLPDSVEGRLRWAVTESLVIAGVFLFWMALAVALTLALSVFTLVLRGVNVHTTYALRDFGAIWPVVVPLAFATTALYVVVRAGTLLVDHYQRA